MIAAGKTIKSNFKKYLKNGRDLPLQSSDRDCKLDYS